MVGKRRRSSPIGAPSSPKSVKVCFAEGDVTGILRPPTRDEHWTLYYFESHAAQCIHCHEPLRVSKQGKRLCDTGHELAVDVANLIFCTDDGKIHSRQDSHRDIRLELPVDYVETVSLLKAIQRGVRKGDQFIKPKSHDRSYFVPSRRTPERFATTPEPAPRFETALHLKRDDPLWIFSGLERGSHYDADMGELQKAMELEQRVPYNVEVRVPSYLQPCRRSSVYV